MRQYERNDTDYWMEVYEEIEHGKPLAKSRSAARRRRSQEVDRIRDMLAEELSQEESGFNFTYKASRHEKQWISEALTNFYQYGLIKDVLSMVKGGKEANVYCCKANPSIGIEYLAAKIYRPRLLRNLKNDAVYKAGRPMLDDEGKVLRDKRSWRAIEKKTRVGSEMTITSWIEYEFQTLELLYAAGAAVPKPVIQSKNAILMEYIGEESLPAPTLNSVTLENNEVLPLFKLLMDNIRLMLAHNRVHADLSAYNILYWQGAVKIIDFPQVVEPMFNSDGYWLLERDIERICQYFSRYRVSTNPSELAMNLWESFFKKAVSSEQ